MYGTTIVTNNEFYLWFVKGYIVEQKGEDVNWAKTTISIAREKAQLEEVKVMKSGGSMDMIEFNGGDMCG